MKIKQKNIIYSFGNNYKVEFCSEFIIFGISVVESFGSFDKIVFKDCKMANDYCKVATRPSVKNGFEIIETISGKTNFYSQFHIHTIYNSAISKINRKFKKYCKKYDYEYCPYELCVIKNGNTTYYHLHNEEFYELYEQRSLKQLVNRFETYVDNLLKNGKPKKQVVVQPKNKLSKLDKHRNSLINDEIERSYNYINFLEKCSFLVKIY